MFFKYLPVIVLATAFLYGCAGNHVYKSQSTYLTGFSFYDPQKKTELEGFAEGDFSYEEPGSTLSKQSTYAKEMPSDFFLLKPYTDTWKAYYYFFQVRKRFHENLPGIIPESEFDIPVVWNDKVQGFLVYFQNSGRDIFSEWLSRSGKYIPMMKAILESKGMPPDLVYLAMIESGFNVRARSRKGAVGPWQFIDSTARRYGLRIDSWVDERMDPEKSTRAAADYLQDLYIMFESWELAAAGYNAGENRIKSAIETYRVSDFWEISEYTLPEETKDYVPKLIAALIIARNLEKYGFTGIEYQEPEPFEKVSVPPQRSLRDMARIAAINHERLRDLNPSLIMSSTPPGFSYDLNVPLGFGAIVASKYDEISALEMVVLKTYKSNTNKYYKVRRGDTLQKIASRYGVGVSALKKANRMKGSIIRIGQMIKIPGASGSAYVSEKGTKGVRNTSSSAKAISKSTTRYKVKKGDTLQKIANRYGVQVSTLMVANNKKTASNLKAGEILQIPQNGTVLLSSNGGKTSQKSDTKNVINYLVKNGDTLHKIASRYDVSVSQIKRWNNLKSTKLIAGAKIMIHAD
ncbi:MAG: LysM peptidoglycan-binding domain-containing protein [Thermodesulfobacteriota bacterium]